MHPKLVPHWTRFEELRTEIGGRLCVLTPDQFRQRAFENKWAVSEVMAHLITSERLSVLYLKKKMRGMEAAGRTGWWAEAKMIVLQISQRLPLKFKAPKRIVAETPSYESIEEMLSDWESVRSEMRAILETFTLNEIDKKIYRHIIAGQIEHRACRPFPNRTHSAPPAPARAPFEKTSNGPSQLTAALCLGFDKFRAKIETPLYEITYRTLCIHRFLFFVRSGSKSRPILGLLAG